MAASLAFCVLCLASDRGAASEALWRALRSGGHVALLRHAIAPGIGDPDGFKLGDCSTQRNLSGAGRAQAEHIGERFRANGIKNARVFSSQWCRCIGTAELLKLGPVEELPALNSFFQSHREGNRKTRDLKNWMISQTFNSVVVLVTHQVNITALTGVFPQPGAIVVVRQSNQGDVLVVGVIDGK